MHRMITCCDAATWNAGRSLSSGAARCSEAHLLQQRLFGKLSLWRQLGERRRVRGGFPLRGAIAARPVREPARCLGLKPGSCDGRPAPAAIPVWRLSGPERRVSIGVAVILPAKVTVVLELSLMVSKSAMPFFMRAYRMSLVLVVRLD
jgi:hypothetical protein